jgi:hypothetical protein
MQVSGVVKPSWRRDVVDQDELVAEDVTFGQDEARHAIGAGAGAPGGIVEIHVRGQVSALVEHLFDIDVTKFQR